MFVLKTRAELVEAQIEIAKQASVIASYSGRLAERNRELLKERLAKAAVIAERDAALAKIERMTSGLRNAKKRVAA